MNTSIKYPKISSDTKPIYTVKTDLGAYGKYDPTANEIKLNRLEDFAEELAHLPIRWLFSGAESGWFIRELLEILPRRNFHVVTVWPFMQTKFDPGLEDQKSKGFRRRIARLEALHRGELLPPAQPRPENPLGALLSDI